METKKCSICDRKHYARGYCLKHYRNFMDGRQIEPQRCSWPKCEKKVHLHIKEALCSLHYSESIKCYKKNRGRGGARPRTKSGTWKYKNYRLIQKLKKNYCEKCGSLEKLHIHHIDGDKSNPALENLITLCCRCHLKEHGC